MGVSVEGDRFHGKQEEFKRQVNTLIFTLPQAARASQSPQRQALALLRLPLFAFTLVAARLGLTSGPVLLHLRQLEPGPASGPGAGASGIL